MKTSLYITILSVVIITFSSSILIAGDDPSIKGPLRDGIQASMGYFIQSKTINGHFFIYDAFTDELLKLKFDNLHKGIMRKGDFYVSCADFVDKDEKKYDLDFLVMPNVDSLTVVQGVVHSVDGNKRKYHLED